MPRAVDVSQQPAEPGWAVLLKLFASGCNFRVPVPAASQMRNTRASGLVLG